MKKDCVSRDDSAQMVDRFNVDDDRLRRERFIVAGVNDMMGFEIPADSMGSPPKWSKVVALNAIGIRPVKLLDLGNVDWSALSTPCRVQYPERDPSKLQQSLSRCQPRRRPDWLTLPGNDDHICRTAVKDTHRLRGGSFGNACPSYKITLISTRAD
jgi:hypothetical protein